MEYKTRKVLAEAIEELERAIFLMLPDNDLCGCEESEPYHKIHHGNLFREIHTYCLKCGGLVEE